MRRRPFLCLCRLDRCSSEWYNRGTICMVEVEQDARRIEFGEVLTPEELLQIPIFKSISASLLQKNLGAVVIRRFKKGEIVCREGDQGTTAFYVLEGHLEVFI